MRGVALGAIAGVLIAGCGSSDGDGGGSGKTQVRTTDSGTVITDATDAGRGLRFEIQSSIEFQHDSDLAVHLDPKAPAATRQAVLGKLVAFTCRIPGNKMRYFPQRWESGKSSVQTALLPDRPVLVANKATTCMLWLPGPSDTPGTVEFSGKPFSQVRLR